MPRRSITMRSPSLPPAGHRLPAPHSEQDYSDYSSEDDRSRPLVELARKRGREVDSDPSDTYEEED